MNRARERMILRIDSITVRIGKYISWIQKNREEREKLPRHTVIRWIVLFVGNRFSVREIRSNIFRATVRSANAQRRERCVRDVSG